MATILRRPRTPAEGPLSIIREHGAEALAGLAVVAVAAGFLAFGLQRTGATASGGEYELVARFPNAAGISVGTDVRVSGLKVGRVSSQSLDPKTFQAVVTLSVDHSLSLPLDTSAAITSESLLGGSYIALVPGGDPEALRPGDEIVETQGATDLLGLVGAFINRSGSEPPPATEP
jgi:phospholipid/cholesterol/gamma-HCH transport system substrate-binding protein